MCIFFPEKIQKKPEKIEIFWFFLVFFSFWLFVISGQVARLNASLVPLWSWYGPGTTPGHQGDHEESSVIIYSSHPCTYCDFLDYQEFSGYALHMRS